MKGRIKKEESGFTLVEILVAMSISIVLIYLLTEILALTRIGWAQASRLDDVTTQEDRAFRILRQTLSSLLPPTPGGDHHTLYASNEALEFITLPPQSRGDRGLIRARLEIEPAGNGLFTLILNLKPADKTRITLRDSSRHVLLSGLAGAQLSYYYEGPGQISVGKPRDNIVPKVIIINWTYPDEPNDRRELAVRPRLDLSGRCYIDSTSGTCRES